MELSLQEQYSPNGICFGCGPANHEGLHIRSFVKGDEVVALWEAKPMHQAFTGILNGGIIGALLDCHCNWTAAWHIMNLRGLIAPPCTVTAEYAIKLLRPTPSDKPIELRARVINATNNKATVQGELIVAGEVCATCQGLFVAVKEDHPAYHRW